jgi:GNAT superfamily N-acetyltransferase
MNPGVVVRRATIADVSIVARHRAEMFTDMGTLPAELYQPLVEESIQFLQLNIPKGEYLGWLAAPAGEPGTIVGGAGVQLRRAMPRALRYAGEHTLSRGREGIVINVFTEKPWRKRGVAALLMEELLAWATSGDLDTLVLHAAPDGRHLYERLGFKQTNEMRYQGWLGNRPGR